MGWASGSRLAAGIIKSIKDNVGDVESREIIYEILIDNFEEFDCDTLDECQKIDPAFDRVWKDREEESEKEYLWQVIR